jgi:hypothetical protein
MECNRSKSDPWSEDHLYEECAFSGGCNAVYLKKPTFRKNIWLTSSRSKIKLSKKPGRSKRLAYQISLRTTRYEDHRSYHLSALIYFPLHRNLRLLSFPLWNANYHNKMRLLVEVWVGRWVGGYVHACLGAQRDGPRRRHQPVIPMQQVP